MPDLTIQSMQQCKSLSVSSAQWGKYFLTGLGSERMWPQCTCPAYQYRRNGTTVFARRKVSNWCKHIHEYHDSICAWHEQDGMVSQTDRQREEMICPKCGGETEWIQVAV